MIRSSASNTFNQVKQVFNDGDHFAHLLRGQNAKIIFFTPSIQCFDSLNTLTSCYRVQNAPKTLYTLFKISKLFFIFWRRVAFRGKSFRVRNFKPLLRVILNFGHSHKTHLYLNAVWSFLKKRRQSYVWFTMCERTFKCLLRFLPRIKVYNRYTMRGLRFKKQAIVRRFGKLSQHISSLH